jgi:cob(I)alamin adenosyltransferase
MRITKVYTKTGDKGQTSLADGSRASKADQRLKSYGTVDELNSVLGLCLESMRTASQKWDFLDSWMIAMQNDLFNIGSDLATPVESRWKNMVIVEESHVTKLENMIDLLQKDLSPLQEFVLPGGSVLNGFFHLARTVCRRAERETVQLQELCEINPFALKYLNRLSDLLFVISRWVIKGHLENTWKKDLGVASLTIPT